MYVCVCPPIGVHEVHLCLIVIEFIAMPYSISDISQNIYTKLNAVIIVGSAAAAATHSYVDKSDMRLKTMTHAFISREK